MVILSQITFATQKILSKEHLIIHNIIDYTHAELLEIILSYTLPWSPSHATLIQWIRRDVHCTCIHVCVPYYESCVPTPGITHTCTL